MGTKYVIGFLFSKDKDTVLLIRKNRPEWQKGKLNGVGGHVEEGETYADAMRREFMEEAGVDIPDWEQYCEMHFPEAIVACFKAFGDYHTKQNTDEELYVIQVRNLPYNVIPNLRWLIPMAIYETEKYMTEVRMPSFELSSLLDEEKIKSLITDAWCDGDKNSQDKFGDFLDRAAESICQSVKEK
jgi:8-oxo-dGTP diphosphatase